jgi:hypothetical protein
MNLFVHYNKDQDQYELNWQQTNIENKILYYMIDYKLTNENNWHQINSMNQTNKQIIHHLDYISNNEPIDYRLIEVIQNEKPNYPDIISYTNTITVSNIACYAGDITFILCYNQEKQIEEYKLINQLRKNDYVRIYPSGYLPIKHIGYKRNYHCHRHSKWNNSFYEVPSNTHNNLVISGYHSILVDEEIPEEMKNHYNKYNIHYPDICDKKLYVIGLTNNSEKYPKHNLHVSKYYHFVLDDPDGDQYIHYGVWANGILSESQNEHDFLYQRYVCD